MESGQWSGHLGTLISGTELPLAVPGRHGIPRLKDTVVTLIPSVGCRWSGGLECAQVLLAGVWSEVIAPSSCRAGPITLFNTT